MLVYQVACHQCIAKGPTARYAKWAARDWNAAPRAAESPPEPAEATHIKVRIAVALDSHGRWKARGEVRETTESSRQHLMLWVDEPLQISVVSAWVPRYTVPEIAGTVEASKGDDR